MIYDQGWFQLREAGGKEARSLGLMKIFGRQEQDCSLVAQINLHS
jgi:hypothetical protein